MSLFAYFISSSLGGFPWQLTEFIIGLFLQVLGLPFVAVAQVSLFSKVTSERTQGEELPHLVGRTKHYNVGFYLVLMPHSFVLILVSSSTALAYFHLKMPFELVNCRHKSTLLTWCSTF